MLGMLASGLRHGQRDLWANNIDDSADNCAAAACAYISQSQCTEAEDQRNWMQQQVGKPTSILDAIHIRELQNLRDSDRYRRNGLAEIARRGRGQGPSTAAARGQGRSESTRTAVADGSQGDAELTPPGALQITPLPPTAADARRHQSTSTTRAETEGKFQLRVYARVELEGHEICQEEDEEKEEKMEHVMNSLASDGNNRVKMSVNKHTIHGSPPPGFSQRSSFEVLNPEEMKRSRRNKKNNDNNNNKKDDDDDNNNNNNNKKRK